MTTFCLKVPVSDRFPEGRMCFDIPDLIREWKFGPPEPPEQAEFRNWRILATIDELAGRLSGDLGRDIVESVAAKIRAVDRDLGEGASLSRQLRMEETAVT